MHFEFERDLFPIGKSENLNRRNLLYIREIESLQPRKIVIEELEPVQSSTPGTLGWKQTEAYGTVVKTDLPG